MSQGQKIPLAVISEAGSLGKMIFIKYFNALLNLPAQSIYFIIWLAIS